MTWLRSLGTFEYILMACFLAFYSLYIVRIILIGRKMKSQVSSVFYKFFLRSFYFFFLIIALLGPSFGNAKKEIKSISRDIYIVTDLSLSMNCNDISPSRLERARHEIKKIITALPSDRFGLIGFTSTARILCPLTYDPAAVKLFTEALHTNLLAGPGSDMHSGLQLALDEFSRQKGNELNKIILFITDGENFGGKINPVLSDIKSHGIHFMVLGIGTQNGGKIPFNGAYKKDTLGNVVVTRLNNEFLEEISEKADGVYFRINNHLNETETLINRIQAIEGAVNAIQEIDASANKYLYFLIIAFFFILIDVLITVKTVQI